MDSSNALQTQNNSFVAGYYTDPLVANNNVLNSNASFNFNDFSQIGSLKLNGTARQISNTLRLNSGSPARSQSGSAFYNNSFALDSSTNFSSHFQSQIDGQTGITFMLQNDTRGINALGDIGGSFGYGNQTYGQSNQINKSIAVELSNLQNPWDTNSNHVALLLNGDVVNAKAIATPSFNLGGGGNIDTWVDYDASSKNLNVYVSNTTIKPTASLFSYNVDLTQVLGSQFYTGFSAGTLRQSTSIPLANNISNWNFSTFADTTAPTATLASTNIKQSSYDPYTFSITYQDASAVKTSTLDSQDIQVTGPNGFTQLATFKSFTSNANNSSATATYSLNAPGGSWNIVDNGTYTASLLANQVSDTYNNFLVNSTLGTFVVNINQDVLTQRNNATRSALNLNETILNTSNVNQNQFGKLFQRQVDGQIYAQPLYVSNVNVPGQGVHNVVYVATMHNTIYAFDADNASATTPLWTKTIGNSVPLPDYRIGGGEAAFNDISVEVGILSTPVIDSETKTMYVLNMQKVGDEYSYKLNAIDITTGQDKIAPVTITGSVPGTGEGSQNGVVPFLTTQQLQRTGLLLANGNIYFGFASFGTADPYHGWVFSYDATTLQQKSIYNTTPNSGRGGIWQSGTGLSADKDGNIYVTTANGAPFIPDDSALANSVIKLNPNLQVLDWFTPYNYDNLNKLDRDLGTGNVTFIPGTNLITSVGKEGKLYLLDRNNLGKIADNDSQVVQSFPILRTGYTTSTPVFDPPIYWNTPNNGGRLYVGSVNDIVKVYSFNGSTFDTTPVMSATTGFSTFPSAYMSISSNGNEAGTGILWSLVYNRFASPDIRTTLIAFDPVTMNTLWTSNDNNARDQVESVAKFNRPTIANGKVYMATFSNVLNVYGLFS